jgi:hypothetical protein
MSIHVWIGLNEQGLNWFHECVTFSHSLVFTVYHYFLRKEIYGIRAKRKESGIELQQHQCRALLLGDAHLVGRHVDKEAPEHDMVDLELAGDVPVHASLATLTLSDDMWTKRLPSVTW